MSGPRVKITYQDYLQLPEEQRYEVLEGDLRMVPPPGMLHQLVLSNLNSAIKAFVKGQRLGQVYFAPVDVILDEDNVVQPDLLVILNNRLSIIKPDGVFGAPNLVVEILSPSNAHRDRGIKRRIYGRYGVQEYWIIDPQERTVEVTTLRDGDLATVSIVTGDGAVKSPLLPELSLIAGNLFSD